MEELHSSVIEKEGGWGEPWGFLENFGGKRMYKNQQLVPFLVFITFFKLWEYFSPPHGLFPAFPWPLGTFVNKDFVCSSSQTFIKKISLPYDLKISN